MVKRGGKSRIQTKRQEKGLKVVLRQFQLVMNHDTDFFNIFGHFAGIGARIEAKLNAEACFKTQDVVSYLK